MTSLVDIAAGLDLASTEPYLRSRGWELIRQGELGNMWRLDLGGRRRNVAVPLRLLDADDRVRMLAAVLDVLSETEARDPAQVADDLAHAASDIIHFHMWADALSAGEMPLHAAPELTHGAHNAMIAAARSEVSRRSHYPQGNLPTDVRSFAESAVLAGTKQGSVILEVRTPPPAEPVAPRIEGAVADPDPFDRRAVRRLLQGVRAAKGAVHTDPTVVGLDTLDSRVDDGLSANLCDALLQLAGTRTHIDARVGLEVRWALTRPTDEPISTVSLERNEIGQLERIAQVLREVQPVPDFVARGPVTVLRLEPGDSEVTIQMLVDMEGRTRTVRTVLDRAELPVVQTVMSNDGELEMTGTLERAGTIHELINPTDLRVR